MGKRKEASSKNTGLGDVIAGDTSICTVGKEGHGLTFRGYSIQDLAEKSTFEEVAYLLIYGTLPNKKTLKEYQAVLREGQSLPQRIKDLLEGIPLQTHPMDVLRTACSALGTIEPETEKHDAKAIASRLMPFCISALLYWYHYLKNPKMASLQMSDLAQMTDLLGQQTQQTQHKLEKSVLDKYSLAAQFLTLLHGQTPDREFERALNVSFILYAEHEFNASTFSARVCASTGSDFYSCIVAAIGTLRGPKHGGANEAAMDLINQFQTNEAAAEGLRAMLAKKILIMGFGHRVYKKSDPRSEIIKVWAKQLTPYLENNAQFSIAETIEKIMWDEKALFPNLDFYSALVYRALKIPSPMFTPLFVIARISGWTAHILEQRANNRLIRPLANYIGPELKVYEPISNRS